MSSFIGNKPNQVPTNGDLGRLAFMDYLGIEDIGASIPTLTAASTITPTSKISFVDGNTTINSITPPSDFVNGGQITLIPLALFNLSTSGNISLAVGSEIGKSIILIYDSVTNKWYPNLSNTINRLSFTGTATNPIDFGAGGTVAYIGVNGSKLSAFAATTSAELATIISDGSSGNGKLVLANSPALTTPSLGVATATSINKVTITQPATSATLTIANVKTLTVNNSITFSATDTGGAVPVDFGAGGTITYATGGLTQFTAGSTTASQFSTILASTDKTGTGKVPFATSPTFSTSLVTDSAAFDLLTTVAATINLGSVATLLTLGYNGSTTSSTTNFVTGASAAGVTKTINIGTGGVAGSTANVNIGSTIAGTTTINYNLDVLQNIYARQNVTAYYTSDKRLKDNITPIQNPLEKILKLSGNTFKWTADYYATQDHTMVKEFDLGVVAQEVQDVLPEAVHERDNGFLAVDYQKIIPLLIECIKEQQKQIDELRGKI